MFIQVFSHIGKPHLINLLMNPGKGGNIFHSGQIKLVKGLDFFN